MCLPFVPRARWWYSQRYPHRRSTPLFMLGMLRFGERLECLALMLSLPFAFLIRGIILLATTLSIVIFRTSDIATVPIAIPIWAAIIILATRPVSAAHIRCLSSAQDEGPDPDSITFLPY
ncbi:hypothetical protein F4604DRAFT_1178848 [Suillus subluteus]|nr:hypothetical protein F4604DRAFT_1178848 [Suillus subluteus]